MRWVPRLGPASRRRTPPASDRFWWLYVRGPVIGSRLQCELYRRLGDEAGAASSIPVRAPCSLPRRSRIR